MKKRILVLMLCMVMALGSFGFGCGRVYEDEDDGTTTRINVINYGGGIGRVWLDNAIARFKELKKDEVYEEGTKGVSFEVSNTKNINDTTMANDGYHVYFNQKMGDLSALAQEGKLLQINDILGDVNDPDSLAAKVYPEVRESLKGTDGNYYGLPHYETYPGLAYDVESFAANGWYFAKPTSIKDGKPVYDYEDGVDAELFTSDYGSAWFTSDNDYFSCGPDGAYGTDDDGLPTSLQELILLCAKVKSDGAYPVSIMGKQLQYGNYLMGALWNSLAGYDQMKAVYQLQADEVEVCCGKNGELGKVEYTDKTAFPGTDIKVPYTTKVKITAENAWLTSYMSAKYYAFAFAEILQDCGFWSADYADPDCTMVNAQRNFIYGGYKGVSRTAMLVDGTYWYNEAAENGTISDYVRDKGSEKKVAWMSLPTSVFDTQLPTEDNKPIQTSLIDYGNAFAYINSNIKNNEGLVRACKDFLAFCYSDSELKEFTVTSGVTRPMNYTLDSADEARMSYYNLQLWNLRKNSKVLFYSAVPETAETFSKVKGMLSINLADTSPLNVSDKNSSIVGALKTDSTLNVQKAFADRFIKESDWKTNIA